MNDGVSSSEAKWQSRRRLRFCMITLASFLAGAFSTAASAQGLVLFPADQYGRSYLSTAQSSGAMSTMELQNVLGRNSNFERLDSYRADDRFRKLAEPVGRLDVLVQTPAGLGTSTCTASVISPRYILTNNHCFPDGVRSASLLMDFYREDDDGNGNRFEARVTPTERNANLDYAVVEVLGDPAARFGTIRLDPRDPAPGESLLVIHHPSGLPKHMTRGGCRAIQPVAVAGTDIRHRCDTMPGSSGSPIFADASSRMLGLHYAGTTNVATAGFNFGKRLSEIVKDSRILAAIVAEQRRQDQLVAPVDSTTRAEIERRAREQAEAAARTEIERRVAEFERRSREQLEAERIRIAALPPPTAPASRSDLAPDLAASEASLGLTTEHVRSVQEWLAALGHDPRGIDGRLGAGTRAALKLYQRTKGLPETGFFSTTVLTMLRDDGAEAYRSARSAAQSVDNDDVRVHRRAARSMDDSGLCGFALGGDTRAWGTSEWSRRPYIAEAQQRGYSVAKCREHMGLRP
jgi:hypothetical protein